MEESLEKLENEWAKFCENASNVKSELEEKFGKWKEFRFECDTMQKILNEFEGNLTSEVGRGVDLQGLDIELKKLKVYEMFLRWYFV